MFRRVDACCNIRHSLGMPFLVLLLLLWSLPAHALITHVAVVVCDPEQERFAIYSVEEDGGIGLGNNKTRYVLSDETEPEGRDIPCPFLNIKTNIRYIVFENSGNNKAIASVSQNGKKLFDKVVLFDEQDPTRSIYTPRLWLKDTIWNMESCVDLDIRTVCVKEWLHNNSSWPISYVGADILNEESDRYYQEIVKRIRQEQ